MSYTPGRFVWIEQLSAERPKARAFYEKLFGWNTEMMAMSSGAKRIATEREAPGFRLARDLSDTLRRSLEWSHDVDEGIAAHRDDRKPKFLGR